MIYIINSFEFRETNVSFSLDTNNKPESRKLERTIPLIQIVFDKLNRQWLFFLHTTLYTDHKGKVINSTLD